MNRMRRELPVIPAIAALLFSFFPTAGHAQNAAPAPVAAAPAQPAGPVLVAKIEKSLTTKNAKVGDVLTAKTLKALKLNDGTDIPKGSKLIAKVNSVQSKQAGNGDSMLTFRFDQAEVKGGGVLNIKGLVVAIGPSLGPKAGLGANSVLARSDSGSNNGLGPNQGRGTGSTNGIDPSTGLGRVGPKDEDDIPLGSTMEGVALGRHLDADWTTALKGVHTDILLDSDVLIKVEFR